MTAALLGAVLVLLAATYWKVHAMSVNSDALVAATNRVTTAVDAAKTRGIGVAADPVDALLPPVTDALNAAAAVLEQHTNPPAA